MTNQRDTTVSLPHKHFLDTSVMRSMLLSTQKYREYFKSVFKDESVYVSAFVRMEFVRSFIINCINFYFVLDRPDIGSFSDAAAFWSNSFRIRELKAILQLSGKIVDCRNYDRNNAEDKKRILRDIGFYIKRLEMKTRREFIDIGKDTARCSKALKFKIMQLQKKDVDKFSQFQKEFLDHYKCRMDCSIHNFLLNKYKEIIASYITEASALTNPKHAENQGFVKITDSLKDVIAKGPKACSCHMCEKIGDAIIALDAPRDMVIESTDYSFAHLCRLLDQPFRKHPSESSLFPKPAN